MARPKTEKATYTRIEVRLPPHLLQTYRDYAEQEGRPLNTQFVRTLQEWVDKHPATKKRDRRAAPALRED
jgi:hypothetical protein